MEHLIKQYLDHGISRRELLTGLGALGMSATAAKSLARSLASPLPQEGEKRGGTPQREASGTGGALLVAQLKAAGISHIFFNPSSGAGPIYDALVDEPEMHLIKGLRKDPAWRWRTAMPRRPARSEW